MNLNAMLNADMTTVAAMLKAGWRWWIGEISAMLPGFAQRRASYRGPIALYDGDAAFTLVERGQATPLDGDQAARVMRVAIALPADCALKRTAELPRLGEADMHGLLALEADRLMPLPQSALLIAADPSGAGRSAESMTVTIAALPRSYADRVLEAAAAHRLEPDRIGLDDGQGGLVFDFSRQLRAEGRLAPRSNKGALRWALVAAAFLLNIGLLVSRDIQSVDQLQALVDGQAPAVSAARTITARMQRFDRNSNELMVRRDRQDALAVLGAVSRSMPDGAWVQRYDWEGQTLRLVGYRPKNVDVIAALRKTPGVSAARPASAEPATELPGGVPFDISVTFGSLRS